MYFQFHKDTEDLRKMPVSKIMNRRTLTTVHRRLSIPELMKLFRKHNVTDFPVVDGKGNLLGDVDMRDVLPFAINPDHLSEHEVTGVLGTQICEIFGDEVDDIMNRHQERISPDTLVEDAVYLLWKYNIHCLPVVEKGKLVGVVSEDDIVKALIERLDRPKKPDKKTMPVKAKKGVGKG